MRILVNQKKNYNGDYRYGAHVDTFEAQKEPQQTTS